MPAGASWKQWAFVLNLYVLLAFFPDLPLPGWGHLRYYFSHSLFVNLSLMVPVALVCCYYRSRRNFASYPLVFGAVAAWLSHFPLDAMYNHGRGVAIFWPLSAAALNLPLPWFVTLDMSQSLVLLPKEPMRPRYEDPRVGYFSVQRINYGLDEQTDPWGIKVMTVEMKDVDLPLEMKRAMAKQAEAERERRAKVIHAEGEMQAAEKLVEAARILNAAPQSLQLRYLQTLTEIAGEKSSTVVFPLPMDLVKPLLSIAEHMSDKGRA